MEKAGRGWEGRGGEAPIVVGAEGRFVEELGRVREGVIFGEIVREGGEAAEGGEGRGAALETRVWLRFGFEFGLWLWLWLWL
jgi:hypothetical protein